MRKRFLFVLILVVAAGAGYYVYARSRPTSLVLTGIVTTNDVIVSPQIAGQIGDLMVKEGDTVKRDQVVAVIRPDELQADTAYYRSNVAGLASQVQESEAALRFQQQQTTDQIRQAEAALASTEAQVKAATADLENARLTFTRTQDLAQQKVASPQELDQARTAYNSAQAKVDSLNKQVEAQRAAVALARSNAEQVAVRRSQVQTNEHMQAAAAAQQAKANVRLQYAEIKAPIDGIVDVRAVRTGEYVQAGQPIVTLINPDDLWVRADVEETYIDRVRLGDKMTIRLPSGDERQGTVFYRGVDAGFATQRDVSRTKRDIKTFEVRLRADNADRRLAVGMTAYVLLPLQ
ncbi:MAG TPA: efflux RND transporter periplasmic adaptor subunit [Vicinamibacterales bacterium]|nr:efflux RND transporter periplasmic adaptor subunit [Vicinamibacterales bacterium]